MTLLDISLNSLRRRKAKALFLVLGLVIAVSTVVALRLLAVSMNAEIASSLDEFGANIIVVPRSEDLALTYGGLSVSSVAFDVQNLKEEDARAVRTIKNRENISIVAPKLLTAEKIEGRTALVVGVDFKQEFRLKKWWSLAGSRPTGEGDAVLGADVASALRLVPGGKFKLKDQTFSVTGVLQPTGSQDDGIVFIGLSQAQALFDKPGQISLIEVAARCSDCPIDEIVAQLAEKLPGAKVTPIRQTIASKMEAMHRFEHFSWGVSCILLLVGVLIAFTTMSASVNERTREIGVFRAIGFRRSNIISVVLSEALLVSLLAGVVGYFIGIALSRVLLPLIGIHGGPSDDSNWALFAMAVALSAMVAMAGSLYPALKASRLDPNVAFKAL